MGIWSGELEADSCLGPGNFVAVAGCPEGVGIAVVEWAMRRCRMRQKSRGAALKGVFFAR